MHGRFGPFVGFIASILFWFGFTVLADAAITVIMVDSITLVFPIAQRWRVQAAIRAGHSVAELCHRRLAATARSTRRSRHHRRVGWRLRCDLCNPYRLSRRLENSLSIGTFRSQPGSK